MNKFLSVFLAFYLAFNLKAYSQLSKIKIEKYAEDVDSALLNDIPSWNAETKRWYMFADLWSIDWEGNYTNKGNYLQILIKDENEERFKIYDNTKLLGKPSFEMNYGSLYRMNRAICTNAPKKVELETDNYAICNFPFCTPAVGSKKAIRIKYLPEEMTVIDNERESCPVKVEHSYYSYKYSTAMSFPVLNGSIPEKYIVVRIDNKSFYLDTRFCKKSKTMECAFTDIKETIHEENWLKIKKHQKYKDVFALNELRKYLLPCAVKKDVECVKKYFVTKGEFLKSDNLRKMPAGAEFIDLVIDERTMNEIRACLNYDNLIQTVFGRLVTRGINKACIFSNLIHSDMPPQGSSKLLSIAYPEAVRAWSAKEIFAVEVK